MNWMTNSAAIDVLDSGTSTSQKTAWARAVHARGLHQFVGHGREELPEQEGGRG